MRLLFDQNLSHRLCSLVAHAFPDSSQVRRVGLDTADDRTIWDHARSNGLLLVSHDSDFAEMTALFGPPPKVIWLRCGNRPMSDIARILLHHARAIALFEADPDGACLQIYDHPV